MIAFWNIFEIFINIFEVCIDLFLYTYLFLPKSKIKHQKSPLILTGILYLLWITLASVLNIPHIVEIMVIIILCYIYLHLFREGQWFVKLFMTVLSNAILASIVYTVTSVFDLSPNASTTILYTQTGYRAAAVVLIHILYLLYVLSAIKISSVKDMKPVISNISLLIMCILSLFSICILMLIEYTLILNQTVYWQVVSIIASLGTLMLNVLVIFLFERIAMQSREIFDIKTESYLSKIQLRYHNEMDIIYQQMRTWRHDYHNHLEIISGLISSGEYDKLKEYVLEFRETLGELSDFIASGNVLLDALLNVKFASARKNGININSRISMTSHMPITDTQLCVLIGNLMDNSIEACNQITNGEKYINLEIFSSNAHIHINIENSTIGTALYTDKFKTTKKNIAEHGIGLKSIDSIINSAGGYCERKHENNVFRTAILLPLEKIKKFVPPKRDFVPR